MQGADEYRPIMPSNGSYRAVSHLCELILLRILVEDNIDVAKIVASDEEAFEQWKVLNWQAGASLEASNIQSLLRCLQFIRK